jgi:hypothetical protein
MQLTSKLSLKITHFAFQQKIKFPYHLSKADIFYYAGVTQKGRAGTQWKTSNQLLFFLRPPP